MKYGIKKNTCGVYMILNKVTKDFYIGSSINISSRLAQHLSLKKNVCNDRLHNDVIKYGINNFEWKVLCECSKENLLELEQFFYDKLQPTYNYVRPCKIHVQNPLIKEKAMKVCKSQNFKEKRKEQYSNESYRKLFHDIQKKRMKPVEIVDDNMSLKFESLSSASRWVEEKYGYKGKSKVSKIREVCEGHRPTAFGFKWQYVKCNDYPERE